MGFTLRRRGAVALATGGMAAAALAGYGLLAAGEAERSTPAARPAAPPDAPAVNVKRATYDPGQSSGWHVHPGVHTVIVLSGTLTVYDAGCRPRSYGVDEPYIGGAQDHLVRNETGEPVEMTVVYVAHHPAAAGDHLQPLPPPEGCPT